MTIPNSLKSRSNLGLLEAGRDVSSFDTSALSAIARNLFQDAPVIAPTLQRWRPYICPCENLIGFVPSGSSVLDIGCGAGLLLSLVASRGIEFVGTGFDTSQHAIDAANIMKQRAAAMFPKATLSFEQIDSEAYWPSATFDIVFLIDVLHLIGPQSQREFLHRAISKVKPGGTLVYKDMCLRPRWRAQANRLHDLVIARERINYVPIERVQR